MSDFISRKEAVDRITDGYQNSDGGQNRYAVGINVGLTKALNALKDVPSVDAVPVRHGKWKVTSCYIKCSECGECFMLIPQNFCPACGARMEEK